MSDVPTERFAEIGQLLRETAALKQLASRATQDRGRFTSDVASLEEQGLPDAGGRIVKLCDLWLAQASQYLSGTGVLYSAGEAIATLPLVRSVIETSARAVHLLDPGMTAMERASVALLEEAHSMEGVRTAAKRLDGEESDLYKAAVRAVRALRDEGKDRFGGTCDDDAASWNLRGVSLASPTDVVTALGQEMGSERQMQGYYDRLSSFAHPGLGMLLLVEVDEDGRPTGGITYRHADHEAAVQTALAVFYLALSRFWMYTAWSLEELQPLEARVAQVFPSFFKVG